MCFHLLSSKQPATIVNTASAIVRQAIALVFEHAAATVPPTPLSSRPPSAAAAQSYAQTDVPSTDASSRDPWDPAVLVADKSPPDAAVMLLKELCRMCRGHDSALLECKPLSEMFLLDVICEVLRSNVALFRQKAAFLEVLREDVCGTLLHIFKQQLDADTEHVQVCALHVQCLACQRVAFESCVVMGCTLCRCTHCERCCKR